MRIILVSLSVLSKKHIAPLFDDLRRSQSPTISMLHITPNKINVLFKIIFIPSMVPQGGANSSL